MSSTSRISLEKMETEKILHSLPLVAYENGNTIVSLEIKVNNGIATQEVTRMQTDLTQLKHITGLSERALSGKDKVTALQYLCKPQPVKKKVIVKAPKRKKKDHVNKAIHTKSLFIAKSN